MKMNTKKKIIIGGVAVLSLVVNIGTYVALTSKEKELKNRIRDLKEQII